MGSGGPNLNTVRKTTSNHTARNTQTYGASALLTSASEFVLRWTLPAISEVFDDGFQKERVHVEFPGVGFIRRVGAYQD
jgi:hypothetical protein